MGACCSGTGLLARNNFRIARDTSGIRSLVTQPFYCGLVLDNIIGHFEQSPSTRCAVDQGRCYGKILWLSGRLRFGGSATTLQGLTFGSLVSELQGYFFRPACPFSITVYGSGRLFLAPPRENGDRPRWNPKRCPKKSRARAQIQGAEISLARTPDWSQFRQPLPVRSEQKEPA